MRRFGYVPHSFWDDERVRRWSATTCILSVYFLTCKHGHPCGTYRLPLRVAAGDLGWSSAKLGRALAELVRDGVVEYDHGREAVRCLDFVRRPSPDIATLDQPAAGIRPDRTTWIQLREFVFERDGHACVYCGGAEDPLECDHVLPVARGGGSDPSNLATACKPCNRDKRAKTLAEWKGA